MATIVIIEDSPWIRKGLSERIPWADLGYDLIGTASDGQGGHDLVLRSNPDFALVDIMMPGMDGLSMIEMVRKSPSLTTKFIIISAFDEFTLTRRALTLGVVDYLLKPVEEKDVVALLTKLGPKGAGPHPQTLQERLVAMKSGHPEWKKFLLFRGGQERVGDPMVEYTMRRTEEVYSSNIVLADIAAELRISESTLSRRFKDCLGFTYVEYRNQLRIWHSARLLSDPLARISEVATLVGFSDQRYFSRMFKLSLGLQPGAFRKWFQASGRGLTSS